MKQSPKNTQPTRLNHEEIQNLNRCITSKEIKLVIKYSKESLGAYGFTGEFYQKFKEDLTSSSNSSKKLKGSKCFQIHSLRPALP